MVGSLQGISHYCHPGLEEEVVCSLFQLAAPQHELRSAFANSHVVGDWVYLETTMNKALGQLLTLTPGVIQDHHSLVYQFIERSEGLQLLNVDSGMQIASGQLVLVTGNPWVFLSPPTPTPA